MSSSEQAPEPTMDEILASIRKIISDDETGGDAQPEAAAAESAAPTGDGLADDLANALNDAQGAAEADEDILDLTQVVSEQPQAEALPDDTPPESADTLPDAAAAMPEAPEAAVAPEAPAAPETVAAPDASVAAEASAGESDIAALLAEAGVQETADEAVAEPQASAAPAGDALNAAMGEMDTTVPDPAPAGETSLSDALSAAIEPPAAEAAPDVGSQSQDASFDADLVQMPEAAPQAPVEPSIDTGIFDPEPGEAAAPEAPELAAAPEAAEIPAAPAPAPDAEVAAEVQADAEFGVQTPEPKAEAAQAEELPVEPEAPVMDALAEPEAPVMDALAEPEAPVMDAPAGSEGEAVAEDVNSAEDAAVAAATGEVRTLEDSVKEMLRPMLREWLDKNMERIVQDEVAAAGIKGQDS